MKRLVVAVIMLALTIAFSWYSYFSVNNRIDKVIEVMEKDREITIYTTSPDSTRTKLITQAWENNETYLVSILAHEKLEGIETGIMCLENYMSQGYTEEYIKTLNECINLLYHVKETERVDTKNIF